MNHWLLVFINSQVKDCYLSLLNSMKIIEEGVDTDKGMYGLCDDERCKYCKGGLHRVDGVCTYSLTKCYMDEIKNEKQR